MKKCIDLVPTCLLFAHEPHSTSFVSQKCFVNSLMNLLPHQCCSIEKQSINHYLISSIQLYHKTILCVYIVQGSLLSLFLLLQLGGSFLLGVGIWVLVDPTGFREIVAANPLLFTGVYAILIMGGMLFLLGFLGCCGAIRENKCLLLFVWAFLSFQIKNLLACVNMKCIQVDIGYLLFNGHFPHWYILDYHCCHLMLTYIYVS